MAINYIFIDLDETLISTVYPAPKQEHISFVLGTPPLQYFSIIHPRALDLIEFSRNLVGYNNVYILTIATKDYAIKVNELAKFRFEEDHILHRQTVTTHWSSTAYGGGVTYPCVLADKKNVLIDNLPWNYNTNKIDLIGIHKDRYFQCNDFYGEAYIDDTFFEDATEFLTRLHNEQQ